MYQVQRQRIKEDIITEFSKPGGTLRIIIGMGIDCPHVRQVLHWGASTILTRTNREVWDGWVRVLFRHPNGLNL